MENSFWRSPSLTEVMGRFGDISMISFTSCVFLDLSNHSPNPVKRNEFHFEHGRLPQLTTHLLLFLSLQINILLKTLSSLFRHRNMIRFTPTAKLVNEAAKVETSMDGRQGRVHVIYS